MDEAREVLDQNQTNEYTNIRTMAAWLAENPVCDVIVPTNPPESVLPFKQVRLSDLIGELLYSQNYIEHLVRLFKKLTDIEEWNYTANSKTGAQAEIRSRLVPLMAETLGSYLREDGAENFMTMELVSPDPEVRRFEVTVRRISGKTPAELLKELRQEKIDIEIDLQRARERIRELETYIDSSDHGDFVG